MNSFLMPTYNRAPLSFSYGKGVWLYTEDHTPYLDFGAGVATSSLGHGHPSLVQAIEEQAKKVIHVSNLYQIPQAEALGALLIENTFADKVFFCNSGAEANEGMVKLMRRAQALHGHPEKTDILCFHGAFHGRTLAMLSATGNPKYLEGFGQVAPGFIHVPYNDINAVKAAMTPHVAAIMLEPIQAESGVKEADIAFLQQIRALCDEQGLYLGIDEVQTGTGRTGRFFAYEWAGITPDVVSVAKGIGGGVPLGAFMAKDELAKVLTPGTHGSTFGGNPLACAAGQAAVKTILAEGFLPSVQKTALYLKNGLEALCKTYPHVFSEVRGKGLLLGVKCLPPVADIYNLALDSQLLTVMAGENVLRILPPLIITPEECDEGLKRLSFVGKTIEEKFPSTSKALS
ncbi:aspartate aminotransferase family protein [Entomobacter blattae]|uniref:Acetylornithine aminotransferase n=1 Tax=Entomobacter blattae TaxID=2762277 RepID=A0A7H1NUR2_9PROT|nr:aspartate aminotransferase family protein [Entomobacter blattae]QNT79522.1 Acetylornithine aminotransferase [Entomobacter blattae]